VWDRRLVRRRRSTDHGDDDARDSGPHERGHHGPKSKPANATPFLNHVPIPGWTTATRCVAYPSHEFQVRRHSRRDQDQGRHDVCSAIDFITGAGTGTYLDCHGSLACRSSRLWGEYAGRHPGRRCGSTHSFAGRCVTGLPPEGRDYEAAASRITLEQPGRFRPGDFERMTGGRAGFVWKPARRRRGSRPRPVPTTP